MTAIGAGKAFAIAVMMSAGLSCAAEALAQSVPASRPAPEAQSRRRAPSTREALDRYFRGDFDGAVRGAPMLVRFDTIEAQKWIAAGGRPAAARRRMAAAMFVLEYCAARPHQTQLLVPWARGVLAEGPASPSEALWLRATIALGEGLDMWPFLGGTRGDDGHIAFARRRFPSDPFFRLADALGGEVAASRAGRFLVSSSMPLAFDRIAADVRESDPSREAARRGALERAAVLLEDLIDVPAVRAEANLRLGFVRLRLGQRDTALVHFDRIPALSREAGVRYLGHLYSAWTLATLGRPAEAVSAYRAALNVVPNAQSATVLLAALLLDNEQLAEAETLADGFLARESTPHDPWQSYFLGDAPLYWTFVLRLREAL